jgi:hypothetical protein
MSKGYGYQEIRISVRGYQGIRTEIPVFFFLTAEAW